MHAYNVAKEVLATEAKALTDAAARLDETFDAAVELLSATNAI